LPHILLAGHFGCGNLGDDAIMLGLVRALENEFEFTVMADAPEEIFRHHGIRAMPRRDMKAYSDAVGKHDALVFAGGSIFQNVTSNRSLAYYANLVRVAKGAKKPVLMVGQGVGPINGFLGRRMAAGAFNAADLIVVRDPVSQATLRELGVKTPTKVAADPAFLLPEPEGAEEQGFGVGNMRTIGIAPRPFGKDTKKAVQIFAELARLLFQANFMPVLIEMDRKHDEQLILDVSKQQGGKVPEMRKLQSPVQIQQRMARMDAVIAMRLHAGILAATVAVPSLMIAYDPKVTALAKMLDTGAALPAENITAQRIFDNFQTFYKERERNIKILERKRAELRKLAEVNVEVIRESLLNRS
jgi:polysaccharide pyruvyl transferase CsaB